MKKNTHINKLAALLSATALAAPVAVLADSHDENERVEVYGFVNLSVDWEGYDGTDDSEDGDLAMNTGSSHFGFRGQEELDGGLKAIYQAELEWTYTGDTRGTPGERDDEEYTYYDDANDEQTGYISIGDSFITQVRDSFVGLEGDFGRLTLGRQSLSNQFVWDGPGADWIAQVGTPGEALGFGTSGRANNVIRYTNDFGAIGTVLSLVPGHGEDPDDHAYNARATFNDGPLSSAFTLWQVTDNEGDDFTLISLAGRYDLDFMVLSAQFSGQSHDADDSDHTGASFGFMMPMGNTGRIKGIVSQFMSDDDDDDFTTVAAGYDHIFSDRTELRLAVAATINDEERSSTPHTHGMYGPSSGVDPAADETHTTVSANLRHSF
ncbi:outer membrane porin protein 32 precursor [Halorhodospira halochloris]|uniref:Outer membrane porin protein 32 n=1 Tax=Halorhodospira halochloris TaxID=1052 RepID=A0A0X8XAI4_HALHR|nr:porin [Halorhodospira halochloris]MBK1651608.1 hypothetical protein [Halorhodospira halochloris]BAU58469.1 outer membrane porin protein 32 precursor [Halorhodospira halochloris]